MSTSFETYGKEPTFEFDANAIDSMFFDTHWAQLDDPINDSIESLSSFDPYKACLLCKLIGFAVESGFDGPTLKLIPSFCERITNLCLEFIEDIRKANNLPADDESDDTDDKIYEILSKSPHTQLLEINADGHRACMGYNYMVLGVMAVAIRDGDIRKELSKYRDKFEEIATFLGHFNYLLRVPDLCDKEDFIVINPETKRGWECVAYHIENNFSLMSLVQFALYHKGLMSDLGVEFDYNEDIDLFVRNKFEGNHEELPTRDGAALDIFTYHAYQSDGTCNPWLEKNNINPAAWVWGEAPVDTIAKIGNNRIILIEKKNERSLQSRTWDIAFLAPIHKQVEPKFEITRELETAEVVNLLSS